MSRPVLPDGAAKTDIIRVRVTPAQRIQLEHAAACAGMSLSALARLRLEVKTKDDAVRHNRRDEGAKDCGCDPVQLDPETLLTLNRLGVNLNQIARAANRGRAVPPEAVEALCAKIEAIITGALPPQPTPK